MNGEKKKAKTHTDDRKVDTYYVKKNTYQLSLFY